eukprot:TRINITY_DN8653_c0_g1_i2.p1 TRINITY_DN8653_c0_g1~~TRINITY_DN8653_c0_g1_i2.p1  ORF type:complete len:1059 (-),score=356.49 TRINITY_DN8653_c0_g1_i2:136-3312(-)
MHREIQNHESALFRSYFRGGILYLDGGIDAGSKKGGSALRLLQVKGTKRVRLSQVPIDAESLNEGDVFILDAGVIICVWCGTSSNQQEQRKGEEFAHAVNREERRGNSVVQVFAQGEEPPSFWEALGGKKEIQSAAEYGVQDDDYTNQLDAQTHLYELSPSGAELVSDNGEISSTMLQTGGVFLLDTGSQVHTWVGSQSGLGDRQAWLERATAFLEANGRPAHTPITQVLEGQEPSMFKDSFSGWISRTIEPSGADDTEAVASSLHSAGSNSSQAARRAQQAAVPVDSGTQQVAVWRVTANGVEDDPQASMGTFSSDQCYIILSSFTSASKPQQLLYFWQGSTSSTELKAASALQAAIKVQEHQGQPVEIRVVQNKEPDHLLQLWSPFIVTSPSCTAAHEGVALYHVRGSRPEQTHAVQVNVTAASLNSGDAFVLSTEHVRDDTAFKDLYIWRGTGCSEFELEQAQGVVARLNTDNLEVHQLEEGEETAETSMFWEALGGKAEYADAPYLMNDPREPRLFQISFRGGRFFVEEIVKFSQDDLAQDDVMLLDCFNEVTLWVGSDANHVERNKCYEIAEQYVASATDGRGTDIPVQQVWQGRESMMFTAHFHGWQDWEQRARAASAHVPSTDQGRREAEEILAEVAKGVGSDEVFFAGNQAKWRTVDQEKRARQEEEEQRLRTEEARLAASMKSEGAAYHEARAAEVAAEKAAAEEAEKQHAAQMQKLKEEDKLAWQAKKQQRAQAEGIAAEEARKRAAREADAERLKLKIWGEQHRKAEASKKAAAQQAQEQAEADRKAAAAAAKAAQTAEFCKITGLGAETVELPYMKLKKFALESGVPKPTLDKAMDKKAVVLALGQVLRGLSAQEIASAEQQASEKAKSAEAEAMVAFQEAAKVKAAEEAARIAAEEKAARAAAAEEAERVAAEHAARDLLENAAATKIQAVNRGKSARKAVLSMQGESGGETILFFASQGNSTMLSAVDRIRQILIAREVAHEEIDICDPMTGMGDRAIRERMESMSGEKETPQLHIRGRFIGAGMAAWEELMWLLDSGEDLNAL